MNKNIKKHLTLKRYILIYLVKINLMLASLVVPIFWGKSIDSVANKAIARDIFIAFSIYMGLIIAKNILIYLNEYTYAKSKRIMEFNIKSKMLKNQLGMKYTNFINLNSGKFVSGFHSDSVEISKYYLETIPNFLINLVYTAFVFFYIFFQSSLVAIIILVVFLIVTLFSQYMAGKYKEQFKYTRKIADKYFDEMYQTLGALSEIKIRDLKDFVYKRNISTYSDIKKEETYLFLLKSMTDFSISLINVFILIVVLVILLPKLMLGQILIGKIITIIIYIPMMGDCIIKLSKVFLEYESFTISLKRIGWLLNPPGDSLEKYGKRDIDNIDSIVFSGVKHEYDKNVFSFGPVNISALKGEKIALVGDSGSGKTTFFRLITRLIDPTEGNIFLNSSIPIKDLTEQALRNSIYMVTQNSIVFPGTIRENLNLGAPRLIKDEELKVYLNAIGLGNFAEDLDYLITEKGDNISGGERQRLEIVRAIISEKPIIIFDEPFSSIDNDSITAVEKLINNIQKDRIIFISSHRLSSITDSNTILVFRNGTIVDRGEHQDLIKRNMFYKSLSDKEGI